MSTTNIDATPIILYNLYFLLVILYKLQISYGQSNLFLQLLITTFFMFCLYNYLVVLALISSKILDQTCKKIL